MGGQAPPPLRQCETARQAAPQHSSAPGGTLASHSTLHAGQQAAHLNSVVCLRLYANVAPPAIIMPTPSMAPSATVSGILLCYWEEGEEGGRRASVWRRVAAAATAEGQVGTARE